MSTHFIHIVLLLFWVREILPFQNIYITLHVCLVCVYGLS